MHIKYINIKNFRGLDIELDNLKNNFLIIGKNDSGKSNLCQAINKVLNYSIRKMPLEDSDSTNFNKKDITIEIHFDLTKISQENLSEISKFVEEDSTNGIKTLCIKYIGKYSNVILNYEEEIFFGKNDTFPFPTSRSNPLDRILSFNYINANYNLEKSKKSFFKFTKDKDIINVNVSQEILKLNDSINLDVNVSDINKELNKNFKEIFENINFKVSSNIDVSNLYKSLDVIPYLVEEDNETDTKNIGDGKSKTLSFVLEYIKNDETKENIFIIEEPENNMYPLLQKKFAKLISQLKLSQIIFTTHSPYIIDLKKTEQIIKLDPKSVEKIFSLNIDKNDFEENGDKFFNELSEMFFYDLVILVEGWTEKYFYNKLEQEDESFFDWLYKKNGGIFCVYGISFEKIKNMLETLGIIVIIKTDNDIYKVSNKELKQYAGIKRVLKCLHDQQIEELKIILNLPKDNEIKERFNFSIKDDCDLEIKKNMTNIIDIFKKSKVIISEKHDGFEGDFYDFISLNNELKIKRDEFIKKCKKAKLINLHLFIVENNITLKINNNNKENCLVNFMLEEWSKWKN